MVLVSKITLFFGKNSVLGVKNDDLMFQLPRIIHKPYKTLETTT